MSSTLRSWTSAFSNVLRSLTLAVSLDSKSSQTTDTSYGISLYCGSASCRLTSSALCSQSIGTNPGKSLRHGIPALYPQPSLRMLSVLEASASSRCVVAARLVSKGGNYSAQARSRTFRAQGYRSRHH